MIEPVALKDFFITFFSSAMIILAGAGYALLYAWSRMKDRRVFRIAAFLSYGVLLLAVFLLSHAANFSGFWLIISGVMVIGYFFAPMAIWYLCVKTHDPPSGPE